MTTATTPVSDSADLDPDNAAHVLPDSLEVALAALVDLGSSLSGLRELAEREDLIALGTRSDQVEAVERTIITLVESMGVGVRLAEAVALDGAGGDRAVATGTTGASEESTQEQPSKNEDQP